MRLESPVLLGRENTQFPEFGVAQAMTFATELFCSVNTNAFADQVIRSLRKIVAFDFFAFVQYPCEGAPTFLANNLLAATSPEIIEDYTAGTYLLDPVYGACRKGCISGLYRLADLAPDEYFSSEYYCSANLHPCVSDEANSLAEEVVYAFKMRNQSYLVLSLMRGKGLQRFGELEFDRLALLSPVLQQTMVKQWPCSSFSPNTRLSQRGAHAEGLEWAFSDFAKDKLSSREQTVVSLLLRGHSTLSIAQNLDIAEGTVKIHRKHIYGKLCISSQAQLFLQFCNHIVKDQLSYK
jgi:DNA-binding CsgD family transcriptional regulator